MGRAARKHVWQSYVCRPIRIISATRRMFRRRSMLPSSLTGCSA